VAKQQKCGTCRFFQEAGLAGSGWCHHPERKTSSDVMIMVRRSELACRDDWSRSLWQPATAGQDDLEPQFSRPPLTGPLPPASQQELTTMLAQDIVSSGVSGEDVLLSEARIISEPSEVSNRWETPPHAIQMPNFDPRTAIFRAREAYRDKVKARATEARMLSSAEPIAAAIREPIDVAVETPEQVAECAESETKLVELPPARGLRTATEAIASAVAPAPAVIAAVRSTRVESQHVAGASSRNGVGSAFKKRSEEQISRSASDAAALESAPTASNHVDDVVQAAVPLESDLPGWYRTDLPRVCRTCRDYRPSADGVRGWCANGWAFTHRRLVQSDDLAPCHSAIGDWWAPVDDVWLVAADVSSHGRATPHLDRLTAYETARRRRS